jgi:two-component system sensor histidine kinase AlgZ
MAFEKQPNNILENTAFLPDFCGLRTVFVVVVLSELLAFLIMLASPYEYPLSWDRLGVVSLFIQWVALSSTAILCVSRRWLSRLNDTAAGYTSYAIVLLVTLVISEASYWVLQYMGLEQDRNWHGEFLLRNMSISAILSALALRIIYLQYQQKLHMRAHANARIQALQARIRPHFLFNSMNTIAAFIRAQPDNA